MKIYMALRITVWNDLSNQFMVAIMINNVAKINKELSVSRRQIILAGGELGPT